MRPKLTLNERVIKKFFGLNHLEKAIIVYGFHERQQEECGAAVKGHFICDTHGIKDTAKILNMSVGRASQYLTVAKAYLFDNASPCEILKHQRSLHKCKRTKKM